MRYLVTGSAGFIGSHVTRKLLDQGDEVIGIDSFNDFYDPSLKRLRVRGLSCSNRYKQLEINLNNVNELNVVFKDYKPEIVIHLAAQAGARIDFQDYDKYFENNIKAFYSIASLSVKRGVRNFVYASSSSVYGNTKQIPFTESDKDIAPINFYGSTKLINEIMIKNIISESNTRARGLRFFTVYGPSGRPDMAYFRLINSAINREKFTLLGNGKIKRDFTYIEDVVDNTLMLANQLNSYSNGYCDVVNIGGGNPHSILELITSIERILDVKINIVYEPKSHEDSEITNCDNRKMFDLIGKREFTLLDEGLETTIDWFKLNNENQQLKNWVYSSKKYIYG